MISYGPVILHSGEIFFVAEDHQAVLGNRKILRRRGVL
jgi:prophage antirepressor-like protein